MNSNFINILNKESEGEFLFCSVILGEDVRDCLFMNITRGHTQKRKPSLNSMFSTVLKDKNMHSVEDFIYGGII